MPGDETRQKTHDESDSESEDEDGLDNIPKVEIDPSTLTPLSPEVISKQVRMSPLAYGYFVDILRCRPRLTWVRTIRILHAREIKQDFNRNDRTCRSRKVDGRKSDLGGHDCAVQERASEKYYDQAGICERESTLQSFWHAV